MVAAVMLVLCGGKALASLQKGNDAYGKLLAGNKWFVSGGSALPNLSDARKREMISGQIPSAIVVTCSDSRVVPEHIFNQDLGDIFVVHTVGNVLGPIALGSIEYAALHLHTHLLIIIGQEKCGAMADAMDVKEKPGGEPRRDPSSETPGDRESEGLERTRETC